MEITPENFQNRINQPVIDYLSSTFPDPEKYRQFLKAVLQPAKYYNLRVNLNKNSREETIKMLSLEFQQQTSHQFKISPGKLQNTIDIFIEGPQVIQPAEKRIYCDKFAAEAVQIGADLFVPGIREIPNRFQRGETVSIFLSMKDYEKSTKINNIHNNYQDLEKIFHIANGIAQIPSQDYPKYTEGIMIQNKFPKYLVPPYRTTQAYSEGYISDQNLPANLAMGAAINVVLPSLNGDFQIYDTCSAPGHKATALAEWIQYYAKIHNFKGNPNIKAIDRSTRRLDHLRMDKIRLDLPQIEVLPLRLEKIEKKAPALLEKGNLVVFDPPCSALGKRNKLFIHKTKDQLEDFARNQRRLLKLVDKLVSPSGYLMYNTCTVAIEENEQIVEYALSKLNYKLVSIPPEFSKFAEPGLESERISHNEANGMLRFYPTNDQGVGYFVALLQKAD